MYVCVWQLCGLCLCVALVNCAHVWHLCELFVCVCVCVAPVCAVHMLGIVCAVCSPHHCVFVCRCVCMGVSMGYVRSLQINSCICCPPSESCVQRTSLIALLTYVFTFVLVFCEVPDYCVLL